MIEFLLYFSNGSDRKNRPNLRRQLINIPIIYLVVNLIIKFRLILKGCINIPEFINININRNRRQYCGGGFGEHEAKKKGYFMTLNFFMAEASAVLKFST